MGLLYEMVTNKREISVLLHEENRIAGDEATIARTPKGEVSLEHKRADNNNPLTRSVFAVE
ncbi:hypothetical protein [Paenibacillus sp. YIM B09110]|uniref:hypothetical protein n=1 Tax=Paenibacillus sp. YIM B09110 TaxID=3126102 RepID=UPI00301DE26B